MSAAVRSWLPLLLLIAAVSCSRDFSSFDFEHDGGGTRVDPTQVPSRDSGQARDAGPRGAAGEAGARPAGSGAAASAVAGSGPPSGSTGGAGSAAVSGSSSDPDDAGSEPQPAEPDAGPEPDLAPQCIASWNADLAVSASCRDCTCSSCGPQILACASEGSEEDRQLCNDVFACALQNDCQDYSCYCATDGCGLPEPVGDGPCAGLMNLAARGMRSQVYLLRSAEVPDLTSPLVKAVRATGCVLGVHELSPGDPEPGHCPSECVPLGP